MTKKIIAVSIAAILAVGAAGYALYRYNKANKSPYNSVPVSEAVAELKDYKFKTHENLKFNCQVLNTDISNVYEIEMLDVGTNAGAPPLTEKERKACWKLAETCFGDVDGFNEDQRENQYEVDGGKKYCLYSPGGTFSVADETTLVGDFSQNKRRKRYKADDDYSNEQVTVGGKTYKLPEIVEFTDKFISDNLSEFFNEGEQQKLHNIIVIDNPGYNDCAVALLYNHMIEGVAVDDAGAFTLESDFMRPSHLEMMLTGEDKFGHWLNYAYYNIGEKKKLDQIIPLSEAEDILSKELAPNVNYTVSECELKYCCKTGYSELNEGEATFRPAWSFTVRQYPDKVFHIKYITAYVDAQTGEVFVFDSNNPHFLQ